MATINERFMDFQIAQQIKWIRLQNRDAQEALKILNRVDAQLETALMRAGIGDAPFTLARLEALKAQITNLISVVHGQAAEVMMTNMGSAAEASGAVEEQLFRRTLPAGLDVTMPNLGVLQQAATLRPFNGAVMSEWTQELKANDLKRTWNTILDGITSGTDTPSLIRSLLGTKPLQYKDGVREVSRRGMEALVRTSINHATNQGRQMVWEANSDIIKGIRWVSTLDNRTTPICQQRDGHVGPVSTLDGWTPPEGADILDPPFARPPAHPNCRSTTVAVTKSWRELGFNMDEMPAGTRASMDGQVPANMTYFQWLAKQSDDVQKDILGPTRWDLWKNKGIQPDRFINDKGQLLTIKQITALKAVEKLPPMPVLLASDTTETFFEVRRWSASISTDIRRGYTAFYKNGKWDAPDSIRSAKPFADDGGFHVAKAMDDAVFKKFSGNYDGREMVRVIDFAKDEELYATFAKLKKGDSFSDVAPSSWSKDSSGLANYYGAKNNVVLEIIDSDLKAVAYDVGEAASVKKEKELILAPGTRLVVDSARIEQKRIGSDEFGWNTQEALVIKLRYEPAASALTEEKVTHLTDFGTQDGKLGWFEWKKNKTLTDYFDELDPKDFGLERWPAKDQITDMALDSGEIVGAIGKVVVQQMRLATKFEMEIARFDLKDVLSSTTGKGGKFLGQSPKPIALKDGFDLTDFKTAAMGAARVDDVTKLRYLDPKEFGLEKWPSSQQFQAMSRDDLTSILGDVRLVVVNSASGGQPKRYMTNLRKKIDKGLNPPIKKPVEPNLPLKDAKGNSLATPKPGTTMSFAEFERVKSGTMSSLEIVFAYRQYELDNFVHVVKTGNAAPKPLKVTLGKKYAAGLPGERIEANFKKVVSTVPSWVLREIEDVSKIEMTRSTRAFHSPWKGKTLLSQQVQADVYVHEFFHALDFKFRFGTTDVSRRSSLYLRDSLDWKTNDLVLNRLAASTREEFIRRDSKGKGRFKNADGDYWLGDWDANYEGRYYPGLDTSVSSEYITMAAQRYAAAKMRGQSFLDAERARMRAKQPAMLELLDYIWNKE